MKAILVMDMPESCLKCPLCSDADECLVQDEDANFRASDSWEELRKSCPLRELPEKKDYDYCDRSIWTHERIGYNACIDEILGGSE